VATQRDHVLSYDLPFGGASDEWTRAGDYSIWTRSRGPEAAPLTLCKRVEGQLVEVADKPYAMHNIPAGTPHRIAGLFGFWRTSEGDTVFLVTTTPQGRNYALIVNTGSHAYKSDRVGWFCPQCNAAIAETVVPTRRIGVDGAWREAGKLVDVFNADAARRTCPGCAAVHPRVERELERSS